MNEQDCNILAKIKYYAENTPSKICLIEGNTGKTISYSSFWTAILRYANSIEKGKYYILQTRQTIDHLIAFYGVQAAGSIAIPVEANASTERINELTIQFDAGVLPIKSEIQDKEINFSLPNPENIACIICTTGTTGKSKGVMSSFRCRYCGADNVRYAYDITSEDVALVPQVLSHSGGLRRVEAMLVSGATAVILGAAMLFGNIFNAIKKYNCTILQFVPAQIAQILAKAEKLLVEVSPQIKIISVGSAVIPEQDKEKLRQIVPNVRLFNDFGSTEAIGSAYFEWSAFPVKQNCVGKTSIHSKIVFLDENGEVMKDTSPTNPGIIATEGGTLMSGYLNAPDLTAEVMQNGRVISSDLGYLGEDDMIYIIGRKDDIIVSGANKISPAEIENAVLEIPGVKECACVPRKDEIMGQMPALFIVLNDAEMQSTEIIKYLSKKLDKFKIPREENIFTISGLPRTIGTGKVIKHQLIEML